MGLISSLDIGTYRLVMALADKEEGRRFHLRELCSAVSSGVVGGRIVDEKEFAQAFGKLVQKITDSRPIDEIHIGLSEASLRVKRVNPVVSIKKKVTERDIKAVKSKAWETGYMEDDVIIDVCPDYYSVDGGCEVADPLGMDGRILEMAARVYYAERDYLDGIRNVLSEYMGGELYFYPLSRACIEVADSDKEEGFAWVDLGDYSLRAWMFERGLLRGKAEFPIGMDILAFDIMSAFGLTKEQALKIQESDAEALKSDYKNKKVIIPDIKVSVEGSDLALVTQCRMEELLEGVLLYLRKSGLDNNPDYPVIISGGGACLKGVDGLLERMSGHLVTYPDMKKFKSFDEDLLNSPADVSALGLLLCTYGRPEKEETGFLMRIKKWINRADYGF